MRVALLQHDPHGDGPAARLTRALGEGGAEAESIAARGVPDAPLRLRKIGDRPGRMPGALLALARGGYDVAHAFTAQDAVAALPWARLTGAPVVFSPLAPLARANVADRRWRLGLLALAVERSSAVVAPDEEIAASLWRWLAAKSRVLDPEDAAAHLALYRELARR
jgi:hypothetical protein